jgi:hypothetical protein
VVSLDLQRLSPRDTLGHIEQEDFIAQVQQLADRLLALAGSIRDLESILGRPEGIVIDTIRLDLSVLHRAVVIRDVVLLAAAIRLLGRAALQFKSSPAQLELWELAACLGDESIAMLCERALSRAGETDELTNSRGENFELILRTTHPDLGAQLFGNYRTSHGSGTSLSCTEHPFTGWAGGPWTRSEVPTLSVRHWLAFRCHHVACGRLRRFDIESDLNVHMGRLLRDLIDGCRSVGGWHSRALVVARCSERLEHSPDIGDGVFAGRRIPVGTFLGITAGRFAESRPGQEEFEYFWDTSQGSIAPRRLGGIIARCQTSFPNLLDLGVPLPCGLILQAFVAMDEIDADEMLVIDYGYNHHTKLNTFAERRPQALTTFIEELSQMELGALKTLLRQNGGIDLCEMSERTPGRILAPEKLAERKLLTQLMYVLGTPSALVEFFWKNPEQAADLESFFCEGLEDTGWLPADRICILGNPQFQLKSWAAALSPEQRAVLSDYFKTVPTRHSGACLMNFLNWLGGPDSAAQGLRDGLASFASIRLSHPESLSHPTCRKLLEVLDREMLKMEEFRLSRIANMT